MMAVCVQVNKKKNRQDFLLLFYLSFGKLRKWFSCKNDHCFTAPYNLK